MLSAYDADTGELMEGVSFRDLARGYAHVAGSTFVASLGVLEDLVAEHETVRLVLGQSSSGLNEMMDTVFDPGRRARDLRESSDELLRAVLDDRLVLRFTASALVHAKVFVLTDPAADRFMVVVGSMNLTAPATGTATVPNHEHVVVFRGRISEEPAVYLRHVELLERYASDEVSADFLQRSTVQRVLENRDAPHVIEAVQAQILEHDAPRMQQGPAKPVIGSIVRQVEADRSDGDQVALRYKFASKDVSRSIAAVFTKTGTPRTRQVAGKKFKQLQLLVPERTLDEEIVWSRPEWHYDVEVGQLVAKGPEGLGEPVQVDEVTPEDGQVFLDIVRSYGANKVVSESHQVLTAFLFLMTAPVLWRIRAMVDEQGINPDQIPVTMALLGSGSSGKTTIVNDYFKPFMGDASRLLSDGGLQSTSLGRNAVVKVVDSYMRSGVVSPLVIDELGVKFLVNPGSVAKVKDWANSRTNGIKGPQGVFVFTSNAEGATMRTEVEKRVLYIPVKGKYRPASEQVYDHRALARAVNDRMYRAVVTELDRRLDMLTSVEVALFQEDFLWLTSQVVRDLLFELEVDLQGIEPQWWSRYSYKDVVACTEARDKIEEAAAKGMLTPDPTDADVMRLLREAFARFGAYDDSQQRAYDEFKAQLPPGVMADSSANAVLLSISKFDAWVGSPVLAGHRAQKVDSVPRQLYAQVVEEKLTWETEALRQEKEIVRRDREAEQEQLAKATTTRGAAGVLVRKTGRAVGKAVVRGLLGSK